MASLLGITPDDQLDLAWLRQLLSRAEEEIGQAPNRARFAINGFVIACGCHVVPLTDEALATAHRPGNLQVSMKATACKVPQAAVYIERCREKGWTGKKKKMARC